MTILRWSLVCRLTLVLVIMKDLAKKSLQLCLTIKMIKKTKFNFLWWLFYGCFEGIGVEGCMIHREGRYSPSEWDWAPVVDYALIPPSPLLNFFIGVAVYFEPKILLKIKYINYSLFTLSIPICRLHAQPSIHAALIFSLVLFVCMFFLNVKFQLKNLVNRGAQLKQPQAIVSACWGK